MLGISLYNYNVHCVLFTLLPVFFYYIIENLRGIRQGLGGTKTLFVIHKNTCGYVLEDTSLNFTRQAGSGMLSIMF